MTDGWEAADRASVYRVQTLSLPTPEDRLFFRRTSLKISVLQVVHGRLFGMVQGKAQQWMPVLLPALRILSMRSGWPMLPRIPCLRARVTVFAGHST